MPYLISKPYSSRTIHVISIRSQYSHHLCLIISPRPTIYGPMICCFEMSSFLYVKRSLFIMVTLTFTCKIIYCRKISAEVWGSSLDIEKVFLFFYQSLHAETAASKIKLTRLKNPRVKYIKKHLVS